MASKWTPTNHRGIYKRGSRYVVRYRVEGKLRQESVRTLAEALRVKRGREADLDRGEYHEPSRKSFRDYATEWIETYQGNGKRGFTEETRAEYRRDLEKYAFPYLSDRLGLTLSGITPRAINEWIRWLGKGGDRKLADATVKRIVSPVRSCLASAKADGLIRANPADGAIFPVAEREVREVGNDSDEKARALSREQLDAILRVVHPGHRPMLRLLAATGLRWGEAAALRRGDIVLDGSSPRVEVRQAVTKGGRFKPPKSKYGIREVPLPPALVSELRKHLASLRPDGEEALAFPSKAGTVLRYPNMLRRVLRPAAEEAGASWAGFHSLRHTYASLHLEKGTNVVRLSRMLGHHDPSFTLRRYAHLIPGDDPIALDLDEELRGLDPEAAGILPATATV